MDLRSKKRVAWANDTPTKAQVAQTLVDIDKVVNNLEEEAPTRKLRPKRPKVQNDGCGTSQEQPEQPEQLADKKKNSPVTQQPADKKPPVKRRRNVKKHAVEKPAAEEPLVQQAAASSSQQVVQHRVPAGVSLSGGDLRPLVSLAELSLMTRAEVYPYLDMTQLKSIGKLRVDGRMFNDTGVMELDFSAAGLRSFIKFPTIEECTNLVEPKDIDAYFFDKYGVKTIKQLEPQFKLWFNSHLEKVRNEGWFIDDLCRFSLENRPHGVVLDKRTKLVIRNALRYTSKMNRAYAYSKLVLLAMAHVDPELPHLRPDWHFFINKELVNSLGHSKEDPQSKGKFKEGWTACVEIVKTSMLAKQDVQGVKKQLLLEDAGLDSVQTRWDAEKGELVRETQKLRVELGKAQDQAAELEEKSKNLQEEKELLKEEFSKQKEEFEAQKHQWESANTTLLREKDSLREEMEKNEKIGAGLHKQLASIQALLEQKLQSQEDAAAQDLKRQLAEKEAELRTLKEKDEKVQEKLRTAQVNVEKLEKELSKMPTGVIVRTGGSTLDLLKAEAKIELNLYLKLYELSDIRELRKCKAVPHLCSFCRGWISPWTDIRILECGHPYHISCVCSTFGVNYLVCWEPKCAVPLPVSWIEDFNLCREVDLKGLAERYSTCQDTRSFPPGIYDDLGQLAITGVPQMQNKKTELLEDLWEEMARRTMNWVRCQKVRTFNRLTFCPPPHQVSGYQFKGWSRREGGLLPAEWTDLWNYPHRSLWIWSKPAARHEVAAHNKYLVTVSLPGFEDSDPVLESLCNLNTVLSFRLRPGDGLFLECIASQLVVLPWVTELLKELVQDKKVVTIWKSGRIPDSVLQDEREYRSAEVFELLSGLFTVSKLWKCGHASHESPLVGSSEPASVASSSAAGVAVSEASSAFESSSASGAGEDSDDECHQCEQPPAFGANYSMWFADSAIRKCKLGEF
ncbi:hypothetical protein R1sor_020157 [Riccia sorocarpa]|uniref:RING-type domain-containing protein n=1 Tax=Riccia sorocarpa TaxID=122646 RepID=A0ABD3IEH4_9MARC